MFYSKNGEKGRVKRQFFNELFLYDGVLCDGIFILNRCPDLDFKYHTWFPYLKGVIFPYNFTTDIGVKMIIR